MDQFRSQLAKLYFEADNAEFIPLAKESKKYGRKQYIKENPRVAEKQFKTIGLRLDLNHSRELITLVGILQVYSYNHCLEAAISSLADDPSRIIYQEGPQRS